MKKILSFCTLLLLLPPSLRAQELPAYIIYTGEGKEVKWGKVIKESAKADVVFFGEQHNDPIGHWLELQLMKSLFFEKEGKIIAGAEMFESDNQLVLDEYLEGDFEDDKFEADARLWENYRTDYKPLVEFAKQHDIPFIATNVPRRYANMVYKGGFEALESVSPAAKTFIAPLPVHYDPELGSYKEMMGMSMGHGSNSAPNLAKAQALKDATMAYFISENMKEDHVFIHFNGAYHSQDHEGILWHLDKYMPGTEMLTIATEWQEDLGQLEEENFGKADYIIVIPADMTRGY